MTDKYSLVKYFYGWEFPPSSEKRGAAHAAPAGTAVAPSTAMVDPHPDPEKIRQTLMERRDRLLRRVRQEFGDEDQLLAERDPEWEELASSQGLAALVDRLGEREVRELARIEAAIRRIDAGTYGRCTSCDAEISPARLAAVPETSLCADCQELAEAIAAVAPPP